MKNVGEAKTTLIESSPASHSDHTASSCVLVLRNKLLIRPLWQRNVKRWKADLHGGWQGDGLDELRPFKRLLKRLHTDIKLFSSSFLKRLHSDIKLLHIDRPRQLGQQRKTLSLRRQASLEMVADE